MTEQMSKSVEVRESISVIVSEIGLVFCAMIVRGEELAKMHHVRGNSFCFPGKWYCISLSVKDKKMEFARAIGEYSSVSEAETAAKGLARELASQIQDALLKVELNSAVEERKLYGGGRLGGKLFKQ